MWARRPAQARAAAASAGVSLIPDAASAVADVEARAASPSINALAAAEVIVLAIRDDATAAVAAQLAAVGALRPHHTLVHCSGARSAEAVFSAVRASVDAIATLHPLRAIADGRAALAALAGTVFGVEGDARGRPRVQHLVEAHLGGRTLALASEQMTAYHAAAVMASNYAVALLDAAAQVLERAGIEPALALDALLPLAQGSLSNVAKHGLVQGLTGPIRRGDRATVARHVEALADDPALTALYRLLGRRALGLARAGGQAARDDLDAIESLLTDDPAVEAPATLRSDVEHDR
ncbi:MAG: hypothetical protein Tsb0020_27730 [Haliangiales bacterium]